MTHARRMSAFEEPATRNERNKIYNCKKEKRME
jgi:hypothetical protein